MTTRSMWQIIMPLFLFFLVASEFRLDWLERFAGAYMERRNAERPRVARFVEQELRISQALDKLDTLKQEAQLKKENPTRKKAEPDLTTQVVRLDNGRKIVMTRGWFLNVQKKLIQSNKDISQIARIPQDTGGSRWTRVIITRGGWFRRGSLFYVNDHNHIISKTSLPNKAFDLLDIYAFIMDDAR